MVTYRQVRDTIERALHEHGPYAHVLAGAVAELVPPEYRTVTYEVAYDKLRSALWPPPRCAGVLARLAWRALPREVRSSVDTQSRP
jgi:hypothetical protein